MSQGDLIKNHGPYGMNVWARQGARETDEMDTSNRLAGFAWEKPEQCLGIKIFY
jgi:hypothetical protein